MSNILFNAILLYLFFRGVKGSIYKKTASWFFFLILSYLMLIEVRPNLWRCPLAFHTLGVCVIQQNHRGNFSLATGD